MLAPANIGCLVTTYMQSGGRKSLAVKSTQQLSFTGRRSDMPTYNWFCCLRQFKKAKRG
jgi:hypothetical protein